MYGIFADIWLIFMVNVGKVWVRKIPQNYNKFAACLIRPNVGDLLNDPCTNKAATVTNHNNSAIAGWATQLFSIYNWYRSTPPKIRNVFPLKRGHFQRKCVVFQPWSFRGHVSFRWRVDIICQNGWSLNTSFLGVNTCNYVEFPSS